MKIIAGAQLTRWGESGVYGFLPHLDSRPSAQILLQSITTEVRLLWIFIDIPSDICILSGSPADDLPPVRGSLPDGRLVRDRDHPVYGLDVACALPRIVSQGKSEDQVAQLPCVDDHREST